MRSIRFVIVFAAVTTGVFVTFPVHAQFRGESFVPRFGDPAWRGVAVGKIFERLGGESDTFGWDGWSSSYLVPDKPAPKEPKLFDPARNDDEEVFNYEAVDEHAAAVADWAFQYSARSLADGDAATCWAEGVDGNGEGEVVIAKVDPSRPVFVRNGFQRSADLFAKNGRVQKLRVYVLVATGRSANQFDAPYTDVRVVAVGETVLKDQTGWQPLTIPPSSADRTASSEGEPTVYGEFVALEIVSVYPGTRYRDTCLTDVANR